jgi:DnaK suppressor protein
MSRNLGKIRAYLESERERLTEGLVIDEGFKDRRDSASCGKIEYAVDNRLELESQLLSHKRIKKQLAEVKYALERLCNGTYGLCVSCDKPISPARLEALPHATLCINCKTLKEKRNFNPDRCRSIC